MKLCKESTLWELLFRILIAEWTILGARCVKLSSVRIPAYKLVGEEAILVCDFDLEGDVLYSSKWYFDDEEFYRWVEKDRPHNQLFNSNKNNSIQVDLSRSTERQVVITNIKFGFEGVYKCEISGEAPLFKTVTGSAEMRVYSTPMGKPVISGGKSTYRLNDMVRVNCTSYSSKPAATLQWYINDELADRNFVREYPVVHESKYLLTTTLGFEFKVRKRYFRNGEMRLKCVASIEDVYYDSELEKVVGEHHVRATSMESRGNIKGSNPGSCILASMSVLVISTVFSVSWRSRSL